jgi:two-component system response regulator YesN
VYKLMIVDDEYLIRKSLMESIDWAGLGIEAGEASNGDNALKKIEEGNPDILITDIRMPILNGLELIRELQSSRSHIKVIIISGYDDFGYAQEAIQLGALGYILKPIENSDVIKMVKKAIASIEEERRKNDKIEVLEQQLIRSMPVLVDKFLNDLVRDNSYSLEEIREKLSFFKIDLPEDAYTVLMIIEIDNYGEYAGKVSEKECQFRKLLLTNRISNAVSGLSKSILFKCQDNQFVLILSMSCGREAAGKPAKAVKNASISIAQRIQSLIAEELESDISIGISRPKSSILQLPGAFEEARTAVRNKLFTGYRSLIHIDDVEDAKHVSYPLLLEREKELTVYIETCDKENIGKKLAEIYALLKNGGIGNTETARMFSLKLALSVKQLALENSGSTEEFMSSLNELYREVTACETLSGMMEKLEGVICGVADYLDQKRQSKHHKMMEKARSFINMNYDRDISLEEAAEYIDISPGYFSQLFRQYTGESFLQYLTNYRLEIAKTLLNRQDLRVYEVAGRVGFNDVKYFDKVFRKVVGVTPSEYKKTAGL